MSTKKDKKNEKDLELGVKVPISSMSRIVRNPSICFDDVINIIKHGDVNMAKEAKRQAIFLHAVQAIDRAYLDIHSFIKFSPLRVFFALVLITPLGYFFNEKLQIVNSLAKWGNLGATFVFSLIALSLTTLFDLGGIQIYFRHKMNKKVKYGLFYDFFTNFCTVQMDKKSGVWLTANQIGQMILERYDRNYETGYIEQFLSKQPFLQTKKENDSRLYFLGIIERPQKKHP